MGDRGDAVHTRQDKMGMDGGREMNETYQTVLTHTLLL